LRRLTISTERYEKIVWAYLNGADAQQWIITSAVRSGRHNFFRLLYAPGGRFADTLAALLEEAAAMENPVYRHSPQLLNVARDMRSAPIHAEDTKQLVEFLKINSTINIEGYVAFRMSEYSYRLDLTTYGLIKRLQMKM
jgi:hypothetical protein